MVRLILLLTFTSTLTAQTMTLPPAATCDPATGLCTPAPVAADAVTPAPREDVEIIYVGDPMCSWCWGISPALNRLEATAEANGIPYRIVVGGLRPGGGDPWNEEMKAFVGHHWEEVTARSGQPFNHDLFKLDTFNYDTEPSCRAVVTARTMDPEVESRFFELTQHRFYVLNEDPKEAKFYAPICEELGLDFNRFQALFASEEMRAATVRDFQLNRSWGVRGYPTVILRNGDNLTAIARGYAEFEGMWERVSSELVR